MLRLRSSPNRTKPAPVTDMTPMIDMVFQLLIFFLLTSIFAARPVLDITLPKAEQSERRERGRELYLRIHRGGALELDGIAIRREELKGALRAKLNGRKRTLLLIVDQEVPFQRFVDAVDIAHGLELSDLAIVTRLSEIPQ